MLKILLFFLLFSLTSLYSVSWQSAQTKYGQPYSNVPKNNIKLCIRDKNSDLGSYTANFYVIDSNGNVTSTATNVHKDDFECILYPNDFKNTHYVSGEYNWYVLVKNKKVINSKFTY